MTNPGQGRRGQVSVFIFVGIFLLIIIGVLFYFRNELVSREFERERKIGVSEGFKPVRDGYEGCVRELAIEGINFVGSQGGYLKVDDDINAEDYATGFKNYLDIGAGRVPYWYYRKSNNIEVVKMPSLKEVEGNIEEYIGGRIKECLESNSRIADYRLVGYDKLKPEVEVQGEKVFVVVNGAIDVELKGVKERIDELYVVLDIPLGRMYNTAVRVFEKENKELFLEERTIDYLGLYDEVPFTGAGFDCNAKLWFKQNVENDFKQVLSYNLPGLVTMDKSGRDKYGVIEVNGNGLDVVVNYNPDWPFYMNVEPNENGVLRSDQIIKNSGITRLLSSGFFCLQSYHFVYDIKYPVVVSIGNGNNVFQFATQVVIENNAGRRNPYAVDEISEESLCGYENGLVNLGVFKVNDNEQLEKTDALISMKCMNSVCELGESRNGLFIGEAPGCVNALVNAEKGGYYSPGELVSTNIMESNSLILEPVYKKRLEIKLVDNKGIRDVNGEYVMLEFSGENGYNEIVSYPDEKLVELVAGEYNVKGYVFAKSDAGFAIGGQEISNCVKSQGLFGLFGKEECFTMNIEESSVNEVLIGGGEFKVNIERGEIVDNNKLVVYLIADNVPNTYEGVQKINENIAYNHLDTRFRSPEWVE